jgi:hypothetical protein
MSQINEAMKNANFNSGTAGGMINDDDALNEDELVKLMNSFGMGGMMGGVGGGGGSDGDDGSDLEEFLPFMTNFMQKLLSKDLLYPVLTDIVDRVSLSYLLSFFHHNLKHFF